MKTTKSDRARYDILKYYACDDDLLWKKQMKYKLKVMEIEISLR